MTLRGGQAEIPILDLAPYLAGAAGAIDETAAKLRTNCETIGFLYIVNHGVDKQLVARAFAESARFHGLPLERKLALEMKPGGAMRGYLPLRGSQSRIGDAQATANPNENESLFVCRIDGDYGTSDRWPDELPGFREAVIEYYRAMDRLAIQLLPLYAVALGLPSNYFLPLCDNPIAGLRLTHYPPSDYGDNDFGIAPHTDSTFLTLLAQNDVPGLQIQTRNGRWIDAPVVPDSFVVNTGNVLNRWTNGRFLSTLHRALNVTGTARYAIPYFFHPNAETLIDCLPTCLVDSEKPKFEPIQMGRYMQSFRKRNYDRPGA